MNRFAHFLRGNGLKLVDVSEWSHIPEKKLRQIEDGDDFRLSDLRHLVGACSYLLGRLVQISELFEDVNEES